MIDFILRPAAFSKRMRRRFKAIGVALLGLFYDVRVSQKGNVSIRLRKRQRIAKKHHA